MERMIETVAVVTASAPPRAWVAPGNASACSGCAQSGYCAGATTGRRGRARQIVIDDPLGLSPGESVVIGIPGAGLLRAATLAYLLPLLALAATAWAGTRFALPLWATLGGALLALGAGLWLAERLGRDAPRPVVLRRLS
ncbi:Fis family transcriptional regulator [Marichromatium sp. AB31]|nr:Fis family transcriptional regulator [Marichromatium sp. AB31]